MSPRTPDTYDRPSTSEHSTGALPAGGREPERRRKKGGWLWWLLGLLLLALVIAALIALLSGGDDDKGKGAGKQQSSASSEGSSGSASGAAANDSASGSGTGSSDTSSGSGSADGASAGRLTAGGTSILPIPSSGLKRYVGKPARGRDVVVLSRVRDPKDPKTLDGFWLGSDRQHRVFVEWGGGVGPDEAKFLPKVGQHVNLSGPVRPAPKSPEKTLNLRPAAAREVTRQGAYINADTVTPAGK
jgi:hypothetical protein